MAEDATSLSLSDDLDEGSCEQEDGASSDVFNILLVGDSGVGKTDLIGRLGEEKFKTKFHATIGKWIPFPLITSLTRTVQSN